MREAKSIFIFGLGYVGAHLAGQLYAQGWSIAGTSTDPSRFTRQQQNDWAILPFTDHQPVHALDSYLSEASYLLSTIAPISGVDPVLKAHEKAIRNFSGWTGYISATSVYPDMPEGWVDETTPPFPATQRGKARLSAERQWLEAAQAEILRVAGIYGPARNALISLEQGKARIIDKPGHFFNRIHQSDISQIITAAMLKPRASRIINLSDKEPAPQADVVGYAAQLLGVEAPPAIPLEQAGLSEMAKSFYRSQRRVRSIVIEPELGVDLLYPDYRSGLKALLKARQQT